MTAKPSRPPLAVRAAGRRGAVELRSDPNAGDGAMPTLVGYFAVTNSPTLINSYTEGRFIETVAPGAFLTTIAEDRGSMRCLFAHGTDAHAGDKPLGPIRTLREEPTGPFYEVPLFDAGYVRDLVPGLAAGVYGASFCFAVLREEWDEAPGPSPSNPLGLPERTLREVRVAEFGPCTFGAYAAATAGLRSMPDELPAIERRWHARRSA